MRVRQVDIKKGPERLKRMLLGCADENLTKEQKLELYDRRISELKSDKTNTINSFCLGYMYDQASRYMEAPHEKTRFWEQALTHYEQVIKKWDTGEPAFYAYYSAGNLAQSLGQPWNKIEEKYLMAFQILPTRGETIHQIVTHYQSKQQWPVAYLFSKFAMEQFFGKMPNGIWGLDESFYSWKVLNAHIVSCYALEKVGEATTAYSQLYHLSTEMPALFEPEDISRIASQKFLFPRLASNEKNSPKYHLQ